MTGLLDRSLVRVPSTKYSTLHRLCKMGGKIEE